VHTAALGWQVRADSSQGQFLAQIGLDLQKHTSLSEPAATAVALVVVLQQVTQQAAVLAFADAYRISFVAAIVAFVLSFLLPGPGASPSGRSPVLAE
jgi:hypothetical protein